MAQTGFGNKEGGDVGAEAAAAEVDADEDGNLRPHRKGRFQKLVKRVISKGRTVGDQELVKKVISTGKNVGNQEVMKRMLSTGNTVRKQVGQEFRS